MCQPPCEWRLTQNTLKWSNVKGTKELFNVIGRCKLDSIWTGLIQCTYKWSTMNGTEEHFNWTINLRPGGDYIRGERDSHNGVNHLVVSSP